MRRLLTAALIATTATLALAPAVAQSSADQRRWQDAEARYRTETQRYQTERDRYQRLGGDVGDQDDRGDEDYGRGGYAQPGTGRPGYAQPNSPQPGYPRGGYSQPGYGRPGYQQPDDDGQPDYGQPDDDQPGPQAGSRQPGYGAGPGGYARAPYPADDRYENGYDPARDYRPGTQERVLSPSERVYAGNDGRYYCKRSDGTTGLIAGGAAGGVLGNVIDGGHSRTVGTLLGGAVGALLGRSVEQQQSQVRCR